MKDKICFKKGDWVVIGIGLVIALSLFVITKKQPEGDTVLVTSNGKETAYSLMENQTIELQRDTLTRNIIVIENGRVFMKEASCPDQICVHHKAISSEGESILCLPNQVYVVVKSRKRSEIDN